MPTYMRAHSIRRSEQLSFTLVVHPLQDWLERRHRAPCSEQSTPVYFAPFSPNGIGNKLLGIVMAFHIALMEGRQLVVSDWPPQTLKTSYTLGDFLLTSSCQRLFDEDLSRPRVKKCSVIECPHTTVSKFKKGHTQPHWAHSSTNFLSVPLEWVSLHWTQWWRAITQYLLQPGRKLLIGLSEELERTKLALSGPLPNAKASPWRRASREDSELAAKRGVGFLQRFTSGVAK